MAILLRHTSETYHEIYSADAKWTAEELEFFIGGHAESIGTLPSERPDDQFIIFANRDRDTRSLPQNLLATGYTGKPVRGHVVVVKQSEIEA